MRAGLQRRPRTDVVGVRRPRPRHSFSPACVTPLRPGAVRRRGSTAAGSASLGWGCAHLPSPSPYVASPHGLHAARGVALPAHTTATPERPHSGSGAVPHQACGCWDWGFECSVCVDDQPYGHTADRRLRCGGPWATQGAGWWCTNSRLLSTRVSPATSCKGLGPDCQAVCVDQPASPCQHQQHRRRWLHRRQQPHRSTPGGDPLGGPNHRS